MEKKKEYKYTFGKMRSLFPKDIMKAVVAADYERAIQQRRQLATKRFHDRGARA